MEVWTRREPRSGWLARPRRKWIAAVAVVALYTAAVFGLGGHAYETGFFGRVLRPMIEAHVRMVPNWVAGFMSAPERIEIDVKQVHMESLQAERRRALATGVLMRQEDSWVPARIRWRGREARVNLRLKGDWVGGQLDSPKWSFRVKGKGDARLFGMREFSLHHPAARNYLYEWLYHRSLARGDILALRYQFIVASLNGKDLGVYAVEEHFDNLMLEANRRRAAPIMRFNEEALWADRAAHGRQWNASPTGLQSWFSSAIDGFNPNQVQADPTLAREFAGAQAMLQDFRRGKALTHQVFDAPRLARFFAISELLGAIHGAGVWHNMRFYFNPVSGRLEPIGFDGDAGSEIPGLMMDPAVWEDGSDEFHRLVFADSVFVAGYVRALEEVTAEGYLEALLEDLAPEMNRARNVLYREWPAYRFETEVFFRNRDLIRNILRPGQLLEAAGRVAANGTVELRVSSVQALPVEVIGLVESDSTVRPLGEPCILPGKRRGVPAPERTLALSATLAGSKVRCRLPGSAIVRDEPVRLWTSSPIECAWSEFGNGEGRLPDHPMLAIDRAGSVVSIRRGRWTLNSPLVIPRGYKLVAGPGTVVDLSGQGAIVSFSPLQWVGEEGNPMMLTSEDRTGRGLFVIGAQDRSILSHVVLRGLATIGDDACGVLGAATFFESPVRLSHVVFEANRSEDALNVMRTDFQISDAQFIDTQADAIDVDFGHGTLDRVSFRNCGNDALDISGSTVQVSDIAVDGAGDKGLSAGEDSRLGVKRATIRNAGIALACKDRSDLQIADLTMSQCELGFAVFQKKPEFGPATVIATQVRQSDVGTPYLLEGGSGLTINGRSIESNEARVRELLYGVKFGKASR